MSAWRLLITRPEPECVELAATLSQVGIYSSSMPLLAIEPLPITADQCAVLTQLADYDAVIVVSKPAARLLMEQLQRQHIALPADLSWFSVGAATAQVLNGSGAQVFYPARGDDSEALLALPQMQQLFIHTRKPRVLLVRGDNGRELLADDLRSRGAQVDYLALYRRVLPHYPANALLQRVVDERLNAFMVSSGQGFVNLRELAADAWPELSKLPLFVPSPRVADMARSAGAQSVVDCRGASATALLAALHRREAAEF